MPCQVISGLMVPAVHKTLSGEDVSVHDWVRIKGRRVEGWCVSVSLRLPEGWSLMQMAGTARRPQRIMLMLMPDRL